MSGLLRRYQKMESAASANHTHDMKTTYVSSCSKLPDSTSTEAHTAVTTIDAAGVPKRGCTSASRAKKSRSFAIAKNSLGRVSTRPLDALATEIRITTASTQAAQGPMTVLAASDATRVLAATPSMPSAEM